MLSNVTPLLYLALIFKNSLTYGSVESFASGKKLAANAPLIVAGLTPSASRVLASPPTEPASQVNFDTRSNFSAALRIVAVVSVVPKRIKIGLPGTALNLVSAPSANAADNPFCG